MSHGARFTCGSAFLTNSWLFKLLQSVYTAASSFLDKNKEREKKRRKRQTVYSEMCLIRTAMTCRFIVFYCIGHDWQWMSHASHGSPHYSRCLDVGCRRRVSSYNLCTADAHEPRSQVWLMEHGGFSPSSITPTFRQSGDFVADFFRVL